MTSWFYNTKCGILSKALDLLSPNLDTNDSTSFIVIG